MSPDVGIMGAPMLAGTASAGNLGGDVLRRLFT